MQVITLRDLPPGPARVVSLALAADADGPLLGVVLDVNGSAAAIRWLRLPSGDVTAARDMAQPVDRAYPALAPDLNAFAYVTVGGELVIERPRAPLPVRRVIHNAALNSMAFTPDGAALYGVSDDGVHGWNADGGQFLYNSEGGADGRVSAAAGSGMYAMTHARGSVNMHYGSDWSGYINRSSDGPVTAMAFTNASGDRLAVARGRAVGVYAMTYPDRGQSFDEVYRVFALPEHPATVTGIAFAADGSRFATSCADGVIRLWDAETGAPRGTFDWQAGGLTAVALSPDGHLGAAGTVDGRALIWDLG
jgi:WD40 repeat protein